MTRQQPPRMGRALARQTSWGREGYAPGSWTPPRAFIRAGYGEVVADQQPEATGAAVRTGHLVEVVERGSFSFAHCTCGWFAPGRRSRDKSRRDAAEHLAAPDPDGLPD